MIFVMKAGLFVNEVGARWSLELLAFQLQLNEANHHTFSNIQTQCPMIGVETCDCLLQTRPKTNRNFQDKQPSLDTKAKTIPFLFHIKQ